MKNDLHLNNLFSIIRQLSKAFIFIAGIGIILPIFIGLIFGIPVEKILALIISTIVLQTWSSPVGIGLKIPPGVIMFVITCFALSLVLAIFEVLDAMAMTSPRVKTMLDKVEKKMGKYNVLYRYGALACFFIAMLPGLGLIATAIIAWLLRFNKLLSVISMVFAFFLVSFVVMLISLGILK